ncbi:hypothetical protein LSM04_007539 [Trypanosoma melophagium]|uniref:uncharacterized protein n=1 Tax=Trypanosoma melophagium TaxID=715481 RepID=UPI00351A7D9D|nr:hypothetical protein LSM04_007539 [Trypanosoma melophagium]
MPYLDHLPVDVPLRELHLESDPEFTALLARYAAVCSEPERAGGPEAKRLEKAMHDLAGKIAEDVATARHRALVEAENLHEKYPYIPEEPAPGVALVEVGVHEDPTFRKLANELEDLRTDPVKNAEQIAAVESAVCARALELAAMKLHATEEECHKYPFLSKRVDGVLLSDLDLADDAVFQEMVERRGAMTSEPQRNREALAEVESQLRDRASCVAAMKKAVDALRADEDEDVRAHNPFLEMNEVKSVPLRELGLPSDPQYAVLTEERLLLKQHPVPNAAAIVATENALRSRAEEIALARLTAEDSEAVRKQRKRPSQVNHPPRTAQMDALPEEAAGDEIVDVDTQLPPKPQRALELFEKDPYYQELNALRDTLVAEGKEVNAPAIQCVEEQMKDRLEQLRADAEKAAVARQRAEQRLLEQHPYLEALEIAGLPLSELGLSDDDEFVALAKEHATLAASPRANAEALAANEQSLRTRAAQLAATLVKKEAALREQMPYLDHLPVDVPLRELHLESDPEFTALLARYAAVCSEPERAGGPEAKRLEKAMHDLAGKIAEDVATARHRALVEAENLHEKYPYIPEEPAPGVALVEVGVHEDPTFRKLANELEDLRTDPVKNAEQIAAVESAVCARALELAAMKLHATEEECHKYPFLSKRVDGVLLSDLDLADDAVFQEMVERRGAMTSEPQRNREALAEVESQLRDRASCVAAMKKAVDALRADEDEDVRAHNPFLEMNEVKSVPLRELGLPSDPQYAVLTEERLLLKQHPVPNAAAIVATENALRSRAEEIALARLTAEDSEAVRKQRKRPSQVNHPPRTAQMDALPEEAAGDEIVDVDTQLPPKPQRALELFEKDPYYQELNALRDTLVAEGKEVNAPAIQCVEEQMKDRLEQLRADAEKAAVARQRAEQRLLEQHPYLEALEIAGLPLSELGLSDDDEFVALAKEHATLAASPRANAEALAANEQSLRTRAAQLAATLVKKEAALREQMPYLDHLPVDVPLRELHLESDPEFTALLARYAAVCSEPERAGGPEAKRLEKAMHDLAGKIAEDVATARHRALVEAENLHEKYPYIPEEPAPGVALVEVGVHEDPTFRKLANELEDLRTDPVKNAEQIAAVESAVCARALELAAMKLHATEEECHKYPFLSKRVDGVLLSDLDLADDAVFQEMVERRGAMTSEPQRNREALAEVESQLRDRASCVAAMKKAVDALRADEDEDVRAHNPFLEMNEVKSVPLRELGLPSDPQYAALADERLLLKQHPVPNAAAIVATENALRSRAEEIALARLTAEDELLKRPPFLPPIEIVDVDTQLPPKPQRALELVEKDPYYQELNALRDTLVAEGKEVNAPAIQCVEEQMKDRLEQLRADAEKAAVARQRAEQRLLEQHPYLEALEIAGLPLSELGLSDDDEFVALAKEHATLAASPRANAEALAANEQSLRTRAAQLAATLVKKEAALREQMPYLDHLPVDVPLRELHLESDPEFTALLARYAAVCSEPERAGGPEAKRLEKAMHDLAGKIAEDVATARHRALVEAENLHEKYPYIPEEPAPGVALVEVGVHEDPTFRKLANELEDLRTDPVKNAEQIAAVESAVCARALELAAMKLHATEEECHKYPFLSKRVDGVLLSDLDLADDAVFQEMVERRGAMTSEPQRNREALAEVESQLRDRASCVAAMKKAVDALRADEDEDVRAHNPFLEMNEVKSVPLRELGLPSDPQYAVLTEERLLLKQHPVPNAAAIVATENALRSRAEEIALARLTAEDELLNRHPSFAALIQEEGGRARRKREALHARYPMLARDATEAVEKAGEVVDVDTQLPPKPQRALELVKKDPYYQELNALRDTLVAEGKEVNAPAIQCVEEQMKDRLEQLRADAEKAAVARQRAEQRLLEQHPYLEALEIAGLPLSELGLSDDDEFVALAKEHATLAASPRANAEALAANEQSLRTRAAQLAATLVKKEAALREQMPYLDHLPVDVPLRELHLESDPEFTALLARYAAVCSEPERAGGPEAKRLEKAMHDLAGKIAEDVATARHRALVEAENLHEKYPYIPEEPAPGVALVEVGVHEDPTFRKLANELEDLRTDPVKNAEQIAAVESAVCARALELAAMKLHATEEECHKYPFLSKRVDGVLLSDLDLADDAVFQEMVERRGAMTSEPQRNREALAEVESQLRDRASCVAAMKKAVDALRADEDEDVRAHNPFLEMNEVKSVPLRELGLPSDPQYAALADERLLLKQHPVPNAAAIVATENALRSRAEEIALARLTAEDELLRRVTQLKFKRRNAQMDELLREEAAGDEIVDVDTQLPPKPQRALELVEKDPYYQELNALRDTLVAEGKEVNAPAIQCVEEQMKDRLEQLRADAEKAAVARQRAEQRLLEQHPYLEALEIAGLPLSELGLSDDDEFVALAKEHATLAASPRANAEALAANEQSLRTRAAQLAATLVKKEAALREQMPYLDHLPVDVPLRELHLESDPEFTALLARYAAVCSEPERAGGPEAKRLEKAMHDLAGKIAEDVATARHRALVEAENLHEKYPYIPEEPAPGVALVEVGVHEDPTFRKLANELEDLRTDPVKNAEQIAAVESAVCARALELAAMKLHATEEECHKYPFLSKRVDGVLLSDLDLADDAVFQEMVERRGAMTSEPQRNREALAEVESQLRDRASCVAAMKKAVDALRADEDEDVRAHNPFLEMNEVKSVPLRELGLPSDPQYAALADERLLLKQHPVPNAAAIVATENALRSRAEEIALARLTAEDRWRRHASAEEDQTGQPASQTCKASCYGCSS